MDDLPSHCWKCGTALTGHGSGVGPCCPNPACDVIDGLYPPEELKRRLLESTDRLVAEQEALYGKDWLKRRG